MDLTDILGKVGFDFKVFLFNVLNFAVLAVLLKKFLFGQITTLVSEREKIIDEGIKKSQLAETEIESAKSKADQILKEAKEKGRELINETTKKAEEVAGNIKSVAETEAKDYINKAKEVAEQEKKSVLENIKKDAAKIIAEEVAVKLASK